MTSARLRAALAAFVVCLGTPAMAQTPQPPVKVGFIAPITGFQASVGRQMLAGAKLYVAQHGDQAGGRTVEVIFKDDTGVADITRRVAQELIVNDKASVLAGFGLSPAASAVAQIITQTKTPAVITLAASNAIPTTSPYFVRVSFSLRQHTAPIADWAAKNGIKTAVSLVADYAPGIDAEAAFKERFEQLGGKVVEQLRTPLAGPDFSAVLQRAKDAKPDALMVFVPQQQAVTLMSQVRDRGLLREGLRIIGPGDALDDENLNGMGDAVIGTVTSYSYSAAHDSPENRAFVEAFKRANDGLRPSVIGMAAYDGMHAIYAALDKTKGDASGDALMAAFKGLSWTSPRGPVTIDPATRDVVQNIYIRRVERKNGELHHMEFETFPNQK